MTFAASLTMNLAITNQTIALLYCPRARVEAALRVLRPVSSPLKLSPPSNATTLDHLNVHHDLHVPLTPLSHLTVDVCDHVANLQSSQRGLHRCPFRIGVQFRDHTLREHAHAPDNLA